MGRAFQNHGYNYRLLLFSPLSSLFSPLSPFHSVTRLLALVFLLPSDYLFNFLVFSCLLYALSVFLYFFSSCISFSYYYSFSCFLFAYFCWLLSWFVSIWFSSCLSICFPSVFTVTPIGFMYLYFFVCLYLSLSFIYFCCGKISCFLIFFPFVC